MLAYDVLLALNGFLKLILVIIAIFLGLVVWAQNRLPNSKYEVNHYCNGEEEQQSDGIDQILFEQDEETSMSGGFRADCACSFCGKLSAITTTCSRCKAAPYCSKVCQIMHRRFWHKFECLDMEAAADQEGLAPHGTHYHLTNREKGNSKDSPNEFEHKTHVGEKYHHTEGGGEKKNNVESSNETAPFKLGIVDGYDGCAVCGNPGTKKCSRCRAIKYCSRTCQRLDWKSRHKFQCIALKANSTQAAATANHRRPVHGKAVMSNNTYEGEDNAHSCGSLCLESYSDGNTNSKALILSSQEDTNKAQMETEEQVRILKEELEKIKNEHMSLQSERENWEMRAKCAQERLYNFRKENEHQLFTLKHENELISNAEKQARQMLLGLSERLHCLQIAKETGVLERRKQETYIHMLQNECAKAKRELQKQQECIQKLTLERDEASQFAMRIAEETGRKLINSLSSVASAESRAAAATEVKLYHPERKIETDEKVLQPTSLTRNSTFSRQACAICLNNEKDMAFGCGHMTCRDCGSKLSKCPICRKKITIRVKLFPG